MPRNAAGTYSLPAGNPVVTATVISSVWANTTLSDIGTALTGSLARNGDGGMTGQMKLADGVIGAPGLTWGNETTSGLYRVGAGDHRYSIAAVAVLQITATGIRTADGGASGPSYSFISDPDTGIYTVGDDLRISTGGTIRFSLNSSRALFSNGNVGQILGPNGTNALPAYAFETDPGTGIYRIGANNVGVSCGTGLSLDIGSGRTLFPFGLVGTPGISFLTDADTGLYRVAADTLGITTGGTLRVSVTTTAVNSTLPIMVTSDHVSVANTDIYYEWNETDVAADQKIWWARASSSVWSLQTRTDAGGAGTTCIAFTRTGTTTNQVLIGPDGTAAVPGLSFNNDADTGFYRDTNNQIGIALAGVTGGQIAQGSFTATATGLTTSPTVTVVWQRFGKFVTLFIPTIGGVSNSTSFTLTGLPAAIQPSASASPQTQSIPDSTDNSVYTGTVSIGVANASGTITLYRNALSTGWTAANNKSIATIVYTYSVAA